MAQRGGGGITVEQVEEIDSRSRFRTLFDQTTSFTIDATYAGRDTKVTASAAIGAHIPLNLALPSEILDTEVEFDFLVLGTGKLTFTWDAGVTVLAPSGTQVTAQYKRAKLSKLATNVYILEGDLLTPPGGNNGGTPDPTPTPGPVVPAGKRTGTIANAASGTTIPLPPGGLPNCTYVLDVSYDTGSTPDVSGTIASTNWTTRQAGYGTGNGKAMLTRFWNGIDTFDAPILNWTGGPRTTLSYTIAVYNSAVYKASAKTVQIAAISTPPTFPSVAVDADGYAILGASNNQGLAIGPPSGYTEEGEQTTSGGGTATITPVGHWDSATPGYKTTETPVKPVGFAAGDYYSLQIVTIDGGPAITATGWTLKYTDILTGSSKLLVYERYEDGSAFGAITAASLAYIDMRVLAYRGVHPTTAIDAHASQSNAVSTNVTVPSVTTTVNNAYLIAIPVQTQGHAVGALTGWVPRFTGSYDHQPFDKAQAVAGASGTAVFTQPDNVTSLGTMLALAPAGASGALGHEVSDKATTAAGSTGSQVSTISGADRSWVAITLTLTKYVASAPPPPTAGIAIARHSDQSGADVISVPSGTVTVEFAELDNPANPTVTNYYFVPVATATAPGYKYVPHAGTPVVDAVALDASNVQIGPWWSANNPRVVTNVSNTPPPGPTPTPTGLIKGSDSRNGTVPNLGETARRNGSDWIRWHIPDQNGIQYYAARGLTMLPICHLNTLGNDTTLISANPQLSVFEYTNEPYWNDYAGQHVSPEQVSDGFIAWVKSCRQIRGSNFYGLLPVDHNSGFWPSNSTQLMWSRAASRGDNMNDYVGGIAIHPYGDPDLSFIDSWHSEVLGLMGGVEPAMGWWITEVGWADFGDSSAKAAIAGNWATLAQSIAARPWIKAVFPYQLLDQNSSDFSTDQATFGYYKDDFSPKPAAQAVATWFGGSV